MRWAIAKGLLPRLLTQAAASPDVEVCGLLLGRDGRIERADPCRNVADSPADSFEIDPAALFAAHRAGRAGGLPMIGCYHSHPTGRPEPSARDQAAAQPGSLWLILAGGAARLWLAGADGHFARCDLVESCHGATAPAQGPPSIPKDIAP